MSFSPFFNTRTALTAVIGGTIVGLAALFKTAVCGGVLGIGGCTAREVARPSLPGGALLMGLVISGVASAELIGSFEPMPPNWSLIGSVAPSVGEGGGDEAEAGAEAEDGGERADAASAGPSSASTWPGTTAAATGRRPSLALRRHRLLVRLAVGGLLMGLGAGIGAGCIDCHGMTGLARLSRRGMLAVVLIFIMAMATATVTMTADALPPDLDIELQDSNLRDALIWCGSSFGVVGVSLMILLRIRIACPSVLRFVVLEPCVHFCAGLLYGVGQAIGGTARPSKVAAFFDVRSGAWDPSLFGSFFSALMITTTFFATREQQQIQSPIGGGGFDLPPRRGIDRYLVIGSLLFGSGWGLTGMCPGVVWLLLGSRPSIEVSLTGVAMLVGAGFWSLWPVSPLASDEQPIEEEDEVQERISMVARLSMEAASVKMRASCTE